MTRLQPGTMRRTAFVLVAQKDDLKQLAIVVQGGVGGMHSWASYGIVLVGVWGAPVSTAVYDWI